MKKGLKIVTIGGGSSYTPELMEGFIKRYNELPIKEIWLVDIEQGKEKVNIDAKMSQRMWDAAGYDVKVHVTFDRREALKDADFVTTQFRVGLLEARIKDERIPLSYGMLGQETNGAGGIFKAFRTIPVILDIVEDMKELCPNAWLINFTNPSGMVTEAVIKYGKWDRCIGLCNVPTIAMMKEPIALNVDPNELIPCGYHRYYYRQQEMLEHSLMEYETIGTRGQQVKETENKLFELYKNPNLDHKPEELSKRGGAYYSDAACECINAIYNNKQTHMVVSTKNRGAIPELPEDSIVEVSCYIGAKGAMPVAWGKLPSAQRGWLQCMKAMEECTIEAAVTGNYGLALEAFTLNELIPSGENAKRVLDELLIAHKNYLPQFKSTIEKLEKENVTIKDSVVNEIIAHER